MLYVFSRGGHPPFFPGKIFPQALHRLVPRAADRLFTHVQDGGRLLHVHIPVEKQVEEELLAGGEKAVGDAEGGGGKARGDGET